MSESVEASACVLGYALLRGDAPEADDARDPDFTAG